MDEKESAVGQDATQEGAPGINFARVAYEAYAEFTGGKTFDGRDMPAWPDLTTRIQSAWGAAIAAVFKIGGAP